jgi:hypothetical protein
MNYNKTNPLMISTDTLILTNSAPRTTHNRSFNEDIPEYDTFQRLMSMIKSNHFRIKEEKANSEQCL